jgi:putative tricarboxylic transport membrane protein
MHDSRMISADRIAALIVIVFFAAYGWKGHRLESTLGVDVVGPGFFPSLIAILGMTTATVLLASRRSAPKSRERAGGAARHLRALLPIGLMLVYVLSLDFLGFPIATIVFLALMIRYLGAPSWLGSVLFALAGTALVLFIFVYLLEVRLPRGDLIRLW